METNFQERAISELQKIGAENKTPYTLNIVGFRDLSNPNKFNDTLVYWYYDDKSNIYIKEVRKFTTDPGTKSLTNPLNVKGCAILKEGYHKDIWAKGIHKTYPALVQVNRCTVYRDNNKNETIDLDPKSTDTGLFGINHHRANPNLESILVDGWSAGCQVHASPFTFQKLMENVDLCIEKGNQKYFSYLLLNA